MTLVNAKQDGQIGYALIRRTCAGREASLLEGKRGLLKDLRRPVPAIKELTHKTRMRQIRISR